MKKKYGTFVMVGIPQEIIKRIPGLKEIFKMGVVQEVNIHMCMGATKVWMEYIPKVGNEPWWEKLFSQKKGGNDGKMEKTEN